MAFDPRKQGFHDKICETLVLHADVPFPRKKVSEKTAPAQVDAATPADEPRPATETGFSTEEKSIATEGFVTEKESAAETEEEPPPCDCA